MQDSIDGYPALAAFLSGSFHQDFDVDGDTIEDIVGVFNLSSSPKERKKIISEISCFLETSDDSIDQEFIRVFNPDIDPTGFASSTRSFLEAISQYLSKQ